jgi:hypothetical protein
MAGEQSGFSATMHPQSKRGGSCGSIGASRFRLIGWIAAARADHAMVAMWSLKKFQLTAFTAKPLKMLVSALGLEPKTYRLKVRCSTN